MNQLRLFIAIAIESTKVALIEKAAREFYHSVDLRWIPTENYHLTLKFLGSTPEEHVSSILENLKEISQSETAFSIGFKGFGVFPNLRHPKSLWVGIEDSTKGLSLLAKKLDMTLLKLGFHAESRDYVPHLTIAKFRQRPSSLLQSGAFPLNETQSFGVLEVQALTLYQSQITTRGSQYTALAELPFSTLDLRR